MGKNAEKQKLQESQAEITTTWPYLGKFIKVQLDTIKIPDQPPYVRVFSTIPGAVAIIPINAKGNLILVEQWRRAVGKITLELPAGLLDVQGESPLSCAERELREETGYQAGKMEPFGGCHTSPALLHEYIHLFIATELSHHPLQGDDTHLIDVREVTLSQALVMIDKGEITDAKTIVGIMRYLKR